MDESRQTYLSCSEDEDAHNISETLWLKGSTVCKYTNSVDSDHGNRTG